MGGSQSHIAISLGNGLILPGNEFTRLIRKIPIDAKRKEETREDLLEGMENIKKAHPKFQSDFMAEMANTSILCLTEDPNNLLMWSHYANKHTGIVIQFSPKDIDSPLPRAKPVRYSRQLPTLKYEDLLYNPNEKIHKIIEEYTHTKSIDWQYEKEWRIVVAGNVGIRPFLLAEIDAIYLGCNITPENKAKVASIAREKYLQATLFQARKSPSCFSLDFEEIEYS